MTDRYSMRLLQWTGSLSESPWIDLADEFSPEALARLALKADERAYAAEIRDSLTGERQRIAKVPALPVACHEAVAPLTKALLRCEAERGLNTFPVEVVRDAKGVLTLALHCAEVRAGLKPGLFNDEDFVRWAIHRAMPAAQLMGHPIDAPPRPPRRKV